MNATATPQVWIGCLAAYNAGALHGKWVDATDADEMYEAAKEIIKTSPAWKLDGHAEEWFIADYDNFPGAVVRELGEYAQFETVANVANAIEEHGEAFGAWLEADGDVDLSSDALGDDFQEHFRGEWDSEEAYAMEQVCSELGWGGVPAVLYLDGYGGREKSNQINVLDELASYIDWDTIAREMFQHGNYTYVRANGTGYVFEDEV
jgi:antirestriction protein